MKKLLALTLALLMVAALLPAVQPHTASAETSGQCGETLYWEFDESTGTLTITGSGDMDSYNSETVPWVSYRAQITAAVLPDGLTSICDYAFYQCTNLSEIAIPDSVTCIGGSAFRSCTKLTEVTIPDNVTSIGYAAFNYCTGLQSVTIGNSVTSIGNSAFNSCTGLTSLTMPCSLTTYYQDEYQRFYAIISGCTSLNYVHLTVGTGEMPDYYFTYYGSGTNYYAWQYTPWYIARNNTLTIVLDDGIQNIGSSTFAGCTGLQEITIPDSVTSIGNYAFQNCTGLTDITIPDGVTSIGEYAFSGCTGLSEITIPGSVISIHDSAFKNCTKLASVMIGSGVTSIGSSMFYGCTSLSEITIPDSVKSIEYGAFAGCTGLTSVTISNSVTSIGVAAFSYCTGLSEISIPDSVTNIENLAFNNCIGLTSLTMPCSLIPCHQDGINQNGMFSSAFSGCTSIENIRLTAGTGEMPDYTATYYSGRVYYAWQYTPWYISESDNLTITLDDGIRCIGAKAFLSCSGLTEITIPDSVNEIKSSSFDHCSNLISVDLGEGLNTIGDYAFAFCTGLPSIVIPDSVQIVGSCAFRDSNLYSITLGKQVKNIDDFAFYNCSELKDVYYHGTERMRNSISIQGSNTNLTNAVWHYVLLNSIGMKTLPYKLNYLEGKDTLDVTGGKIATYYDYDIVEEEDLTADMVSGFDNTVVGPQTLTVMFEGQTTTFDIEIVAKSLDHIAVTTLPDTLSYLEAKDELDLTGGRLTLYYDNDTNEEIDLAADMVSGFDNTVTGTQTLTISYEGKTTTFDVEILPKSVSSIEMTALPEKTEYLQRKDQFDVTGGRVMVYYNNDTSEEIDLTADMVSGFDNSVPGTQTLTVSYGGKQTTFDVEITPHELIAIEITRLPDKTDYRENTDKLDLSGAVLTLYYNSDWSEGISLTADMVSGFDNTVVGTQTLTVTFEGYTTTFDVTVSHIPGETVIENEVEPTCTTDGGYDEVVYCDICGEELSREHITIPATGHIPGEPVIENETEPTYTTPGHYDEVVYCTVCHAELSRETVYGSQVLCNGVIEWNSEDVQFKGSTAYVIANGNAQTPRFTVKNRTDGSTVDPTDYDYEYRENTRAGTGYVFVTFKGDYSGTCRGSFKIYLPATTSTTVANVSNGIKLTWTPVDGAAGYVIYRRAWSTTTNGWTAFARWDNTTETTYIDGHDDAHKVYAGTRYQYGVKAYFARRTDPVTGAAIGGNVNNDSGNFNLGEVGPLKTTVRITTRTMSSVTGGLNQVTAKWEGSSLFTGYQIQYATDSSFSNVLETITISNAKTTQRVVKNLTSSSFSGTRYYVRVRSYHVFNGMTYYGGWSTAKSAIAKPKYRAIIFGETNYSAIGASSLPGCTNDAYAMSGMLQRINEPFCVSGVTNARYQRIMNEIDDMSTGTTADCVSVFYFSGHGLSSSSASNNGALVTVDGYYITFSELATKLSKVNGRVIVILDSCHSGASIGKSQNAEDVLDAFNAEAIEAFSGYDLETGKKMLTPNSGELKKSKFVVITAASGDQSSYDGKYDGSGYRQGAFTAALIKGMGCRYPYGLYGGSMPADKNSDDRITLKELFSYTYNKAYEWTRGSGSPQRAQYYGSDAEVLFSR